MINIGDKLISDDVVNEEFVCNLSKCKGACCWDGDYGAPLTEEETLVLGEYLSEIRDELTEEGRSAIDRSGYSALYSESKFLGTALLETGACVFLTYDGDVAKCGIEKAFEAGRIPLKKPISCHLYPIRITEVPHTGIHLINYDRWDICSAACALGKNLKVPVYEFVKEALVRKYGPDFYDQLHEAVQYMKNE